MARLLQRNPILWVTLLLTLSCGGTATLPDPFAPQGSRSIQIQVDNRHFSQATLHAHRQGQRVRLGVINGKNRKSYQLAWDRGLELRIEIDILAAGSCITRPMQVDPGEVVSLQIQSRMDLSPDCYPTRQP